MAKATGKQQEVRPGQLISVADRRFDDAAALCATGQNARANGAQYLAGLVLDILLKAQLMRLYPVTGRKRSHEVRDSERVVWNLIWRSHDLSEMLIQLPDRLSALDKKSERAGKPYSQWLRAICAEWSILLRYSTRASTIAEAQEMLERVRQLKELLK